MPQQEPDAVLPEATCPFWTDGKHLWEEGKSHGHVAYKTCSCGALIKIRPQD